MSTTWNVSASGSKDEVKKHVQVLLEHPGHHQPVCALIDNIDTTHVSLTASGDDQAATIHLSGYNVEAAAAEAGAEEQKAA